jgi:exosortase B
MQPITSTAPQPANMAVRPSFPIDLIGIALAMVAMYAPTLITLFQDGSGALWREGEHSHGPIMLALALWLTHTRWQEYAAVYGQAQVKTSEVMAAWGAMLIGAVIYTLSRGLGIIYLEVASFIPTLMGMILLRGGWALLSALKFPVFFCIFMVPLPAFLIDGISHWVKTQVSIVVAELLWQMGYPISRSGVVLSIGPYQLLVADACAGMRTLFMLEAMGIFYLNVVRHSSMLRNLGLALLIIPISFTANTLRVIALTLITYYFGDEAGQGFMHGFAGIVLFATAMLLLIGVDTFLRSLASSRHKQEVQP